jgi:hypothetical protein
MLRELDEQGLRIARSPRRLDTTERQRANM